MLCRCVHTQQGTAADASHPIQPPRTRVTDEQELDEEVCVVGVWCACRWGAVKGGRPVGRLGRSFVARISGREQNREMGVDGKDPSWQHSLRPSVRRRVLVE